MRHANSLVTTPDFTIRAVSCAGGERRWSAPEHSGAYGIVLVRSGRFRVRTRGGEMLAEPTTAYLMHPDDELEFAHPGGGDVCTSVTVSPGLWGAWRGEPPGTASAATAAVPVDGRVEAAHLALLRAARDGDAAFAAAETVVRLLGAAITSAAERAGVATSTVGGLATSAVGRLAGSAATRAATRAATGPVAGVATGFAAGAANSIVAGYATMPGTGSRIPGRATGARLVLDAREAILAADPAAAGLIPLARRLGVSPYHLSRVFRAHAGVSLTRYRNRVRVSRALDRLAAGERDLGLLAADLGFADQAHLTRTVRAHAGLPPGRLRDLLARPDPAGQRRPAVA